ncbi:MAG: hypothetical protein FWF18_04440 [Dehalococcoidia bacterium]|nr:hypothetical protein [Dehalococcoidia bacterium]
MVSYEFRTSPSWRERSDRRIWRWGDVIIHYPSRCYDQVHPGGSVATEGSGGGES